LKNNGLVGNRPEEASATITLLVYRSSHEARECKQSVAEINGLVMLERATVAAGSCVPALWCNVVLAKITLLAGPRSRPSDSGSAGRVDSSGSNMRSGCFAEGQIKFKY
jgi:hypothetical protein